MRVDFSGNTAKENRITIQGAGFNTLHQADVTYGSIPSDNAFPGATDGRGAVVTAQPGKGVMIFGQALTSPHAGIIRCSVRADGPEAQVHIAAVDIGEDQYASFNGPANGSTFHNRYQWISTLYVPPTTGFQPFIQIYNTSPTRTLTVYLDNFDVYLLTPGRYYDEEFLNGDASDPAMLSITSTGNGNHGETITIPLPNLPAEAKPLEMVLIKAGTFAMGSPADERGRNEGYDWPLHQVILTQDFYIGRYEVTQAQYQAIMNNNPSFFSGKSNNPVESVTWYECAAFCNRLSEREGLTPVYNESTWATNWNANGYRLPTEAEWECACRAGTTWRFSHGNVLECDDACGSCADHDLCMWWCGNSGRQTHEVGLKLPNPWGLYDMHGNVWEWCNDWWEEPSNPLVRIDPTGVNSGSSRVYRGGDWFFDARFCRSADRYRADPVDENYNDGFRLSRTK